MNANILLVLSLAGVVYAQAEFENNHLDRLSPKAREFVENGAIFDDGRFVNNTCKKCLWNCLLVAFAGLFAVCTDPLNPWIVSNETCFLKDLVKNA